MLKFEDFIFEGFDTEHSLDTIRLTPHESQPDHIPGRAIDSTATPHVYGSEGISGANRRVSGMIQDKSQNKVYGWANSYSKQHLGRSMPTEHNGTPSSLEKQSAIGAAYHLAAQEHPEYQKRVFQAYQEQRPDIIKETGAHDYHSLLNASYSKMAEQTHKQFDSIPLRSEYKDNEGYRNSNEMLRDVHLHNHITVYRGGQHENLNHVDPQSGLTTNEKFRLVHDTFGHAIHGNAFGPQGEETAWSTHSQMYTPAAQAAMSAETRGQNSFVNYSKHNIDTQVKMRGLYHERKLASDAGQPTEHFDKALREAGSNWNYAPNKSVLLPPEMIHHEYNGHMPEYIKPLLKDIAGKPDHSTIRKMAEYHSGGTDETQTQKNEALIRSHYAA